MQIKSALAAFLVVGLAACSPKNDDKQAASGPANVTLTDAQRRNIRLVTISPAPYHRSIEVTGVVDFDNDQATSVISPISGPVSRIFVSPGDIVAKGAPLAAVASPDFAAAVGAYRKALITAQNARRIADADKDLVKRQSVSQREADQAETDAVNAEADRDAALQAVVALNVDPATIRDVQTGKPLDRIEGMIRSPVAGTVVERSVTQGQLLQAGTTPTFTVANLSKVWVMAQVFESDIAAVHVGDSAKILTDAAPGAMAGTVTNIVPEIDPNTRSMQVRVAVDNRNAALKRQMYVRVLIQSRRQSTGLLAPVSSVLRDDENLPFVYVIQPDGSFARQRVTLGSRIGDNYEVGGLRPGARIVADGALFLQFMQNQ
jgi:cobalt-zinc-cadmium efflux system membrane fusion protein